MNIANDWRAATLVLVLAEIDMLRRSFADRLRMTSKRARRAIQLIHRFCCEAAR